MTDPAATGRVLRVIREADRVTMPWKNGGGVTHELVREGEGAAGFGVRLSIAVMDGDGPFSRFPGVDRVILMLDGGGFRLRRDDGREVTVAERHVPFAFSGDDAWDATLLQGEPVVDFNVMSDRATRRATVALQGPGLADGRWLLALSEQRVGGVRLLGWELAEIDGPVLVEGQVIAVGVFAAPV